MNMLTCKTYKEQTQEKTLQGYANDGMPAYAQKAYLS